MGQNSKTEIVLRLDPELQRRYQYLEIPIGSRANGSGPILTCRCRETAVRAGRNPGPQSTFCLGGRGRLNGGGAIIGFENNRPPAVSCENCSEWKRWEVKA